MSGLQEDAKSGERFDAIVRKPRALLTKEERRAIAAQRGVNDAEFALKNALEASAGLSEKIKAADAELVRAKAARAEALSGLEAK